MTLASDLAITANAWRVWEQALDTNLDAAYLPHHSISATSCRTHTYRKDLLQDLIMATDQNLLYGLLSATSRLDIADSERLLR